MELRSEIAIECAILKTEHVLSPNNTSTYQDYRVLNETNPKKNPNSNRISRSSRLVNVEWKYINIFPSHYAGTLTARIVQNVNKNNKILNSERRR